MRACRWRSPRAPAICSCASPNQFGHRGPHPQSDTERGRAPASFARVLLAAQYLAGADQGCGPLELLGRQQPQGVAHEDRDARTAGAGLGAAAHDAWSLRRAKV